MLYSDPTLRPPPEVLRRGAAKVSALWSQGISGDLPIVLVRIEENDDLELVRQLLRAHEYWRLKQLAVDLVILNERASSYVQDLQIALDKLVRMNQSMPKLASDDSRGAVFVLRADLIPSAVRRDLLYVECPCRQVAGKSRRAVRTDKSRAQGDEAGRCAASPGGRYRRR